jgi:hypothetical protein
LLIFYFNRHTFAMSLLHTPELDKIKPFPTPPTLTSPILSPLPEKIMADQPQNARGLPTPKTTPLGDALIDSFKDGQVTDNAQAARVSIDRLTSGRAHTADFVPSWPATPQGSFPIGPAVPYAYDSHANTGRYSSVEVRAAATLIQLAHSQTAGAVPQKENPGPSQAAPQSLHGRKRRLSQVEATSRTSEHAACSSGGLSSGQQTQPTSVKVRTTARKATLKVYHSDRARTIERYAKLRRVDSSSHGDVSQTVKAEFKARTNTNWFKTGGTPEGRAEHLAEQKKTVEMLRPHQEPLGTEIEKAKSTSKLKPVPSLKATKAGQRRVPERADSASDGARRLRMSRATPLQRGIRFPSDESTDSESETESGSSYQSHLEETKATGGKPRRSPEEQDGLYDGPVQELRKMTGGKRKRSGEELAKGANSNGAKKGKAGGMKTEPKVKNPKDDRLGDIKSWLCSKTTKVFPPKKPGGLVTPDHKGDWEALDFVRLPAWGSKIDTAEIDFDERLGPKAEYAGGDPKGLHRQEQEVARLNNLTYDQYRCQKRRVFAARAVFDQIHASEKLQPSWNKTQTQLIGSIDANKASYLYTNFNRWGWFDTMQETWDDEYLQKLVVEFLAYRRKPWTPPLKG